MKGGNKMTLKEAIEVLKDAKYIGSDEYASDYDKRMNEAIDTVVTELEKPLPSDEQIEQFALENILEDDSSRAFVEMKRWVETGDVSY